MHPKVAFFFFLICTLLPEHVLARNYYVDPVLGDDLNPGTSVILPIRSLERAGTLELKPGDALLLAAGHTFTGSLILKDVHGTAVAPITIASYSWGNALQDKRARIDARGFANGIYLADCSHLQVKDLIITADGGGLKDKDSLEANMRCGVLVTTTKAGLYHGIALRNLLVQDVFFEDPGFERGQAEVRTANGSQRYGWGIRFINQTEGALLKDLSVADCVVKNVAHTGIKFTARGQRIENIQVSGNRVLDTGGPGIQMSGVRRGHITGNYVNRSGSPDDSRKWGRGSGLWTWGSSDILIEKNHFLHANGPGDSAGCHIDFNCANVVVQYNFSAYNAGGFCEILGNNHNCAYRYNISVNDGHRVKGQNGAFQEGKTFWLSGYVGQNQERQGPYNSYFYNNTIYVDQDIVAKIAVTQTAKGVLIANNIFYIEGESQAVLGDQYNPEKEGDGLVDHVLFTHNLFLKADSWPKEVLVQPDSTAIGDPQFFRKGGLNVTDYLPADKVLVRNQGVTIPYLPKDSIGLTVGLKVEQDILGSPIRGRPDLGAIELE